MALGAARGQMQRKRQPAQRILGSPPGDPNRSLPAQDSAAPWSAVRQQRAPDEGLGRVASPAPDLGADQWLQSENKPPTASPRRRAAFRAGAASHTG